MIRVIVCDDHAIVRRGLLALFADQNDIEVVGEAANGADLLDLIRTRPCDSLVLDISMPGRSGLDVLHDLHSRQPGIRVLMLTMHPEEQFAIRALHSGAAGYLSKDCAPQELVRAVRRIAAGGKYIGTSLAERLAETLQPGAERPPHERLSDREFAVLRALAAGKTVREIAELLFLSANTVGTYRTRLLQKLKLRNSAQLAHYASTHHLLD